MGDFDTSLWQDMAQQERDRVMYAVCVLEGSSPAAAAKSLGHDHKYGARVTQHLKQYGTFAEVGHHKGPTKFTSEVMAAAQQKLVDSADVSLTTGDLVQLLEQDGLLAAPTDRHNFLVRFKEHLAAEGLTLQVGSTSTIFRITEESALERYSVAYSLLQLVPNDAALQDFIFEDETTFEESPHPKGKGKLKVFSTFAGLVAGWWAFTRVVQCQLHKALRITLHGCLATTCAACTEPHGFCISTPPCRAEARSPAAAHQGDDGPT